MKSSVGVYLNRIECHFSTDIELAYLGFRTNVSLKM